MLKVIWNDPVWSKVIAASILALVAFVGTYFLNWWPIIGSYFSDGYVFITSKSLVPNWLLGMFALLVIPTLLLIGALIYSFLKPESPSAPSWKNYTFDNFFGIVWRWKYIDNTMSDMHTFCPHCDFQIFPKNASGFNAIDRIAFLCDSCHANLGEFNESYLSLENKAQRFSQQKIRNGSWNNKSTS